MYLWLLFDHLPTKPYKKRTLIRKTVYLNTSHKFVFAYGKFHDGYIHWVKCGEKCVKECMALSSDNRLPNIMSSQMRGSLPTVMLSPSQPLLATSSTRAIGTGEVTAK